MMKIILLDVERTYLIFQLYKRKAKATPETDQKRTELAPLERSESSFKQID